jgi:hypothetical protein
MLKGMSVRKTKLSTLWEELRNLSLIEDEMR